jgi:hypothetical protein
MKVAKWRMTLRNWMIATLVIGVCLLPVTAGLPQQGEETDGARGMWSKKFIEARAKAERERERKKASSPTSAKATPEKKKDENRSGEKEKQKTKPEVAITAIPAAEQGEPESKLEDEELIGLTLWRVREAGPGEDPNQRRSLRQTDKNGPPLIPERVDSDTVFKSGDLVRLSVEVPRLVDCYLYVIDREVSADGTIGSPYLIFPNTSTPRDGNILTAGRQVYIPASGESIPYFRLKRSNNNHVGEQMSIIISPAPLKVTLGPQAEGSLLEAALVDSWEKQWGATPERRESRSNASRQWTEEEKEADEGKRSLRQADPLPQTIYRASVKPGSAVLVNLLMRIAK